MPMAKATHVNWAAGNHVHPTGRARCPDCGSRKAFSKFMWVNGSRSIRCLECLDKREKGRVFGRPKEWRKTKGTE